MISVLGLVILLIFSSAVAMWLALPYVIRKIQVSVLKEKCRKARAIVLTYDDGPTAGVTKDILEILAEYKAKATFFVLGNKVSKNSELINDIVSSGHELAAHSYCHLHAWKSSPFKVYLDTKNGFRKVMQYGGVKLYRPPYGKLTLLSLLQTLFNGYRLAWWTIDSTDSWSRPASVSEVLNMIRQENGGVILMHDSEHSLGPNGSRNYSVELSRVILEFARDEGFCISTLESLYQTS
jgi:peptidoglycan/xylan/chitin deacetylase (PgdA/CDA1 family)